MARQLESSELSAFFDGLSMMVAAGIQTDEAVIMLAENMEDSAFSRVCRRMYTDLAGGSTLAQAMELSGAFPPYARTMVDAGERAGHLENVLRSLTVYYDEEARLFDKVRSAVLYPTALLVIMTVILIFTVAVVLPIFRNVYTSVSGSNLASSFVYVHVSQLIGYVALALMVAFTLIAIAACVMSRGDGRYRLIRALQRLGFSRDAMYRLALSRFTAALATFVAAGMQSDAAMEGAIEMIDHPGLEAKATAALASMTSTQNPLSLAQAIYEHDLFDALYSRMMLVGSRSGSVEGTLETLSDTFFEDAIASIDGLIDSVEPALAGFMTIAVGATLIAVMLPLIGIMGSIG